VQPDALIAAFQAPLREAASVDLADPAAARSALRRAWAPEGPAGQALRAALVEALQEGTICDRGPPECRYSRLVKADPGATGGGPGHGFSVDLVCMTGPGPRHRHTKGEVNLCFALEGDPRFDGQPEGWVVFPPGSEHVPTVTGGRMLIAYFLPGGAIEWTGAPAAPAKG
jgi:hypothetical protein